MSAIQTLQLLVSQLSESEIKLCRQYLIAFDSRGEKFISKSLKLFDHLASGRVSELSEREMEFLIYGKRNTPTFARLQLRLRDKILDTLVLEMNVIKESSFPVRIQKRLLLRRKLNHADALLSRNLIDLAESAYEGAAKTAVEYELFDELLAALRLQEQVALKRNDLNQTNKLNSAILKCRQTISVIETATQLDLLERLDKSNTTTERLKELKTLAKEAPSAQANYLLLDIEIKIKEREADYTSVHRLLKQQVRLLTPKAFSQYEELEAKTKLKLAQNAICLRQFSLALRYGIEAGERFKEGHPEYVKVLEVLGKAYFQSKRFNEAKTLLDQETFSRHSDELGYLKAVTCFVLGEHEEAETLLADFGVSRLTDKKHGAWPFLVLQMIRIEWGIKKDTSRPLKQAQKNLKVFRLHEKVTPRENIAWTVLLKLAFAEFDFKMIHQHSGTELEKLRIARQEYAIPAGSPELIPFDKWFMAMVMKISLKRMLETS